MSRLGRDKLRMRATSFGVDRSQAACWFEAFDLVKEIGQTCDRSATVRLGFRTLNNIAAAQAPLAGALPISSWRHPSITQMPDSDSSLRELRQRRRSVSH